MKKLKISFNPETAKEMGKDKFIKTFKPIYGLTEKELSETYNSLVPEEKKPSKDADSNS